MRLLQQNTKTIRHMLSAPEGTEFSISDVRAALRQEIKDIKAREQQKKSNTNPPIIDK